MDIETRQHARFCRRFFVPSALVSTDPPPMTETLIFCSARPKPQTFPCVPQSNWPISSHLNRLNTRRPSSVEDQCDRHKATAEALPRGNKQLLLIRGAQRAVHVSWPLVSGKYHLLPRQRSHEDGSASSSAFEVEFCTRSLQRSGKMLRFCSLGLRACDFCADNRILIG